MILWINGPFGVSKTTLVTALLAEHPGWVVFDPEEIGFLALSSSRHGGPTKTVFPAPS